MFLTDAGIIWNIFPSGPPCSSLHTCSCRLDTTAVWLCCPNQLQHELGQCHATTVQRFNYQLAHFHTLKQTAIVRTECQRHGGLRRCVAWGTCPTEPLPRCKSTRCSRYPDSNLDLRHDRCCGCFWLPVSTLGPVDTAGIRADASRWTRFSQKRWTGFSRWARCNPGRYSLHCAAPCCLPIHLGNSIFIVLNRRRSSIGRAFFAGSPVDGLELEFHTTTSHIRACSSS